MANFYARDDWLPGRNLSKEYELEKEANKIKPIDIIKMGASMVIPGMQLLEGINTQKQATLNELGYLNSPDMTTLDGKQIFKSKAHEKTSKNPIINFIQKQTRSPEARTTLTDAGEKHFADIAKEQGISTVEAYKRRFGDTRAMNIPGYDIDERIQTMQRVRNMDSPVLRSWKSTIPTEASKMGARMPSNLLTNPPLKHGIGMQAQNMIPFGGMPASNVGLAAQAFPTAGPSLLNPSLINPAASMAAPGAGMAAGMPGLAAAAGPAGWALTGLSILQQTGVLDDLFGNLFG